MRGDRSPGERRTSRRRLWGLRALSIAVGAVAVGLGYALTYLLASGTVLADGVGLGNLAAAAADPPGLWQSVGWLYVGLHYVPVDLETSFGYTATTMVQDGPAWTPVVAAVPPVAGVLAAATAVVAGRSTTLGDAVLRSFWVVPGYFAGIAGLVLFSEWRFATSVEWIAVSVPPVRALAVGGGLVPAGSAAVGALLAYGGLATRRRFAAGGVIAR